MGDGAQSRPRIQVGVLGPLRTAIDGRTVDVPSGRLGVLLAVLAMSAHRPVSVERMTDALWGDDLPQDARRSLQTYIARLRAILGVAAIAHESGGYVLLADEDDIDALRFMRLVEDAGEADERAALVDALRLWRGQAFDGLASDWLDEREGARLNERYLEALERRIDLDLTGGRPSEVVAELRELVAAHPLRESLWVGYLSALSGAGRYAEALTAYENIRTRIADELGVAPGPALQSLYQDLLAGTSPSGRDSSSVRGPDTTVPRQLPADLPRFAGRTWALAALDNLIDGADQRRAIVAAVYGAGGVGKTSLVVHWAHQVAERFPDGQLYVDLRGFGPREPAAPAAALDALLRGLGVAGDRLPAEESERTSLLRSTLAECRVLLVLDNARDAEQVRPLLPGAGGSMAVVTSRSQLRGLVAREGAHRIGMDVLDPDESVELLASALDAGGVAYDKESLAELARLCGQLPLALVIAAERATRDPGAGLDELLGDLHAERDRLDTLDIGEDESVSLRSVFAWSYRALGDQSAQTFRLLGLLPGTDFGIPAVAALIDEPAPRTRRLLDWLVAANLVQQRKPGRYDLHDLMRAYAMDLAERHDPQDARDDALDRYLEWCVRSAVNARAALASRPFRPVRRAPVANPTPVTFDGDEQALAWFDTERVGLIAAIRTADGYRRYAMTHELAALLWLYLMTRAAYDDLHEIMPLAADAARRCGDLFAEADIANLMGTVYGQRADYTAARECLTRALELYEQVGDDAGRANVLTNLGIVNRILGDHEQAVGYFELALAEDERQGEPVPLALSLTSLATIYVDMGRPDDAVEFATRALTLCSTHTPGSTDEAAAIETLGLVRAAQGRTDEAIELFTRALVPIRAHGDQVFEAVVLAQLGRAHRDRGQLGQATDAWRLALDLIDGLTDGAQASLTRAELVELLASVAPS